MPMQYSLGIGGASTDTEGWSQTVRSPLAWNYTVWTTITLPLAIHDALAGDTNTSRSTGVKVCVSLEMSSWLPDPLQFSLRVTAAL